MKELTEAAYGSMLGIFDTKISSNGLEKVAPEYKPVKIPTRVMPIWMVENISFGFSDNSKAVFARSLPDSANSSSLRFFAFTMANSVMENKPFAMINTMIMIKSKVRSLSM